MRAITRFRLAACGRKRPICTMAQCRRSIISSFRASARPSSSRAGSTTDKKLVGFSWEPAQTLSREGYRFDTTSFPALSNKGHDKDVIEDGKTLKLDWSDDIPGAMAIVEYLKTK